MKMLLCDIIKAVQNNPQTALSETTVLGITQKIYKISWHDSPKQSEALSALQCRQKKKQTKNHLCVRQDVVPFGAAVLIRPTEKRRS